MTAQIRAKPLIASIALAMGGGFLSNRLSGDVKGIYQTLNLPWFAPPDWVFAVVWPVLYLLIAAAYYLVKVCDVLALQVIGICMGSFCLTILAYHLCRKVPVLRKISGCV